MNVKQELSRLLNLMMITWTCYWRTGSSTTIAEHKVLEELHEEIKKFCDEFMEIVLTTGYDISIIPNEILLSKTVDRSQFVDLLKEVRQHWIDLDLDEGLEDFQGRLISRLTHFIFILNIDTKTLGLFSNKKNDKLIQELKKRFNTQNEFVNIFNSYLKGKDIKDQGIKTLFRNNEEELTKLSNAILESNTQLFSLKGYYSKQSNDLKGEFNDYVKFFDAFLD